MLRRDLSRAEPQVDAVCDRATAAIDLTRLAHRLGRATGRLPIVGTIALPMAFLASSFGQSFDWLTDRIATGWALALPGAMMYCMLLACALVPPSAAALADLSARRPRARGARS